MPSFGPSVKCLLGSCRPAAVSGFVSSIIVNPVNGQVRRGLAHVGEKIFKSQPSLADRNPSSAVVFVACASGPLATLNHASPDSIGARWSDSFSTGMPVFECAFADDFSVETSTAGCVASEVGSADAGFSSAIADTGEPIIVFIGEDDEATESFPYDIFVDGHGGFSRKRSCQESARRFSDEPIRYPTTKFNDGGGGLSCRDGAASLGFSVVRGELLPAVWPDGRRRNYFRTIEFRKRGV